MNKKKIKAFYIWFFSLFPSISKNSLFVSILNKENITGPSRFVHNLEKGLAGKGIGFERTFLSACKYALIISSAPESFYRLCKKRNVKTILRVDGFTVPIYYDNVIHIDRNKREFTKNRMYTNHEIQIGLLLSDFVVYQSEFSRKMANKYLFNRVNRYAIISNSVDVEHFRCYTKKVDKIRLVVLGTLRDFDILKVSLDSFVIIKNKYPDASLTFVGTMKADVEHYMNQWLENNSQMLSSVCFTGTVFFDELPDVLSRFNIALHLTSGDSCPNSVLENLSCSNPVVCVAWGGASELVGEAGVVINQEPYSYDGELSRKVANAIELIYSDLPMYSKLARKRAENNYSLDVMTNKYLRVLEHFKNTN